MFRIPLFGRRKLILAFEYGVIISETAKKQGVEMTPALIAKAEVMVENEFRSKSAMQLAIDMVPNILSIFETDATK